MHCRPTLTVLSWNMFLGTGSPNDFFDHVRKHWNVFFFERGPRWSLEPLLALIAEHQCDVVCLQEVDAGSWRNGYRNLVAEIAERTPLSHHVFAAQRKKHCHDGIALFSRYALQDPTSSVLVHDFEQRGLIRAHIDVGGHSVCIAVTHLAAFPFNGALRLRQVRQIASELGSEPNVILAADFNCDPKASELQPLTEQLSLRALISAPSFPAYRPRHRLDNVFASTSLTALEARVLPTRHSDHLPVLARFQL